MPKIEHPTPGARLLARTAVALLSAGLLTACGTPTPSPTPSPTPDPTSSSPTSERRHVLDVQVTGTAVLTSLTFTFDGKATEEANVVLPWTKKVEVPYGSGRHEWELAMRYDGGDVGATGTVDGKLLTRTEGSASPGSNSTANLSGGFTD
ncbi:hypothetical protein ACFFQW_40400 [Umezawaea endophytica]|uniref:Uncharacterized protein n=1 Tax=Umezawaea endophytica TaxID=1654476 RepID=A0A9X3A5W2_9PSEU|nr:hypothetical protein [Umezawaea endophytica]MCS7484154.1 hypothetical protein [Umezawaea endophytica]